jgi:hypothetical protein
LFPVLQAGQYQEGLSSWAVEEAAGFSDIRTDTVTEGGVEQCSMSSADRYEKQLYMTVANTITCRAMQRQLSRQVRETAETPACFAWAKDFR